MKRRCSAAGHGRPASTTEQRRRGAGREGSMGGQRGGLPAVCCPGLRQARANGSRNKQGGRITSWHRKLFPSKGGVWNKRQIRPIAADKAASIALLLCIPPRGASVRSEQEDETARGQAGSQRSDNERRHLPPAASRHNPGLAQRLFAAASPLLQPLRDPPYVL